VAHRGGRSEWWVIEQIDAYHWQRILNDVIQLEHRRRQWKHCDSNAIASGGRNAKTCPQTNAHTATTHASAYSGRHTGTDAASAPFRMRQSAQSVRV
jgi:hypothetical protein